MKKAFTLVELLVVIAVIGILSAIITPNLLNARNSARIAAGQRFDSSVYHSIGDYLVGEWMFDVQGSPLIDTSGMNNNGTTSTDPVYYSTGGYNNKGAFSFDGTDDFVNVGNSPNLNFSTADFSLSVWIKTSIANEGAVISKQTAGVFWQITVTDDASYAGKVRTSISDAVTQRTAYGPVVVSNNSWHHVAVVYDRDGKEIVYTDGVAGIGVDISSVGNINNSGIGVQIGILNSLNSPFNGYIDDVRIYATALSSSEIEKIYAEGKEKHVSGI